MTRHSAISGFLAGVVILTGAGLVHAQSATFVRSGFQPFGWGGYGYRGYGYHSSTAGEGYQRGAAVVIQAAGEYNLNTSQAAINYAQAYRMSLENSVAYAETYFAKRRINESYRESKEGPPPSQETLAERAHQGVPDRLTAEQFEPAFGTVFWPAAFDDRRFSDTRNQLDRLMADRDAWAGVGSAHYRDVIALTDAMRNRLREKIFEMSPAEYVQAFNFLDSVAYEARFVPEAEGLAAK